MQYIGKIDIRKIKKYKNIIKTQDVILTDERLEHILSNHYEEYMQLKSYFKIIIEEPDYILEDNRHNDTMIFLKNIENIELKGRIVVKIALGCDEAHCKNSIITMMKLNKRTWKQTLQNRGIVIWKKLDKIE